MPPITILVALADPTRCRIIEILRDGPLPVHVLAGEFKISRPAISRHLRVLKEARLISEKKLGRENRYGLHPTRLKSVRTWLEQITAPAVTVAEPKAAAPKPEKSKADIAPARAVETPKKPIEAQPKPSLSQMGFDF